MSTTSPASELIATKRSGDVETAAEANVTCRRDAYRRDAYRRDPYRRDPYRRDPWRDGPVHHRRQSGFRGQFTGAPVWNAVVRVESARRAL